MAVGLAFAPSGVTVGEAPPGPETISGMKAWFKADALSGLLSDGDPVSSWTDSSGNGSTASSAGGNRPLFKTGILNAMPVLRFDGSNDTMAVTFSSMSQPYTYFLVAQRAAVNDRYYYSGNGNASASLYHTSATYGIETADGGATTGSIDTDWHIICVIYNGVSTEFYEDGVVTPLVIGTGATTGITIGSYYSGILPFQGDISEVILYSGSLSSGDRNIVEDHLSDKYGIAVS